MKKRLCIKLILQLLFVPKKLLNKSKPDYKKTQKKYALYSKVRTFLIKIIYLFY